MELPGVRPRVSSTAIDFDLEDAPSSISSKFSDGKSAEQALSDAFKNVRIILLYFTDQKTLLYSFILVPPLPLYIHQKNHQPSSSL